METQPLNIESCRAKLDPVHAEFLDGSESRSVPVDNVKELRIGFRYSTTDNFDELERFLQLYTWPTNNKPRKYVAGLKVAGVTIDGTWRQAFTSRIERMDSNRQTEFLLVITLRRGWATSIDWSEALLMQGRETDGNSKSVPAVSDTTSFDHAKVLTVRFPNIDPSSVQACLASIPTTIPANSVTLQGVKLTELWHRAVAIATKTEDGTSTIDLVLTRSRFTVAVYQAFGTPAQRLGYKIFDVPRSLANTITDNWQATGRSADISQPNGTELCALTLWSTADEADTTSFIAATNCAFFIQRTYYTNAATIPDTPENEMGITYTANFQIGQDTGKYNGWIEKRVRQTLHVSLYASASDHDRYIQQEVWSGVYLVGALYKSVSLSLEDQEIVSTPTTITDLAPSTDVPAQGEALSWTIRPNEDCTLDATREVDTERVVAAAGKTTTVDAFTDTLVAVARGMTSGGEDITALDGTNIKLLRWNKDRYGKYEKEEKTLTPVAADSDWVDYPDRYGTSYYRTFRNQTLAWIDDNIVDEMDNTTSNSLSISENPHTLYDGVATRQAYNDGGAYGTFFRSTRTEFFPYKEERRVEDELTKRKKDQTRDACIIWRSAITASYADADNAITDYREVTSVEDNSDPVITYTDLKIVKSPSATMVADPDGHRGIRVEVAWKAWKPGSAWA